jgi:hypothetical protein
VLYSLFIILKLLNMKTFLPKAGFLTIVFLIAHLFFASVSFGQAIITSNEPDYSPLSNAVFTGAGFSPNENVLLKVENLTKSIDVTSGDPSYSSWTVIVDANGAFVTNWTVCNCRGDLLRVSAYGQSSGENVWHEFTDASITSTTSGGNWNSTGTWVGGVVPSAGDVVTIAVGATVTVTDNRSATSITLAGGGSNTKLQINPGITLSISGNVTINAPGANSITNEFAVGAGALIIGGNLSVDGANGGTGRKGIFSISSGTVNLMGSIINPSNNSNAQIVFSGSGVLSVAGSFSWGSNSTFTYGTGTIDYNGAAQTILARAYNNLTLSGSGIKSIPVGTSIAANLSIAPTGSATASVGVGLTINVGSLTLGGLGRINGLWGSTTVTTATYKNNTYFSATTGKVDVTTDTRIAPVITWTNPADITYGTALSVTQLNATSVGGTFVYSPALATVLNSGAAQNLQIAFTPTDQTSYNTVSKTVQINVNKANQVITWNNPLDITYGTALSATQLNASVVGVSGGSATGALTYTPASGAVLNAGSTQNLKVDIAGTYKYN